MSEKSLPEMYHATIGIAIDEKGVYPHQAIGFDHEGKTHMMSLMLPERGQTLLHMANNIRSGKYKELMWSLDRMCKNGQGTTLGDCVAGVYWNGTDFKPFIIEYQHDPRIVKDTQWDNEFWNSLLREDIALVKNFL